MTVVHGPLRTVPSPSHLRPISVASSSHARFVTLSPAFGIAAVLWVDGILLDEQADT